jgi:hypothetical protein
MKLSLLSLATIALISTTTAAFALDSGACRELSREVTKELSTMNYCEADTDCSILEGSCAVSGHALVNKESVTKDGAVYNLKSGYNVSEAVRLLQDCPPAGKSACVKADDIRGTRCVEHKCVADLKKS